MKFFNIPLTSCTCSRKIIHPRNPSSNSLIDKRNNYDNKVKISISRSSFYEISHHSSTKFIVQMVCDKWDILAHLGVLFSQKPVTERRIRCSVKAKDNAETNNRSPSLAVTLDQANFDP